MTLAVCLLDVILSVNYLNVKVNNEIVARSHSASQNLTLRAVSQPSPILAAGPGAIRLRG